MPTYAFAGVVLPERASFTLPVNPPLLEDESERLGGKATVALTISASQVCVVIQTDERVPDLKTLRNTAQFITASICDACGYAFGIAFDVEIVSVLVDGQDHEVFGADVPTIHAQPDRRALPPGHDLFKLALETSR